MTVAFHSRSRMGLNNNGHVIYATLQYYMAKHPSLLFPKKTYFLNIISMHLSYKNAQSGPPKDERHSFNQTLPALRRAICKDGTHHTQPWCRRISDKTFHSYVLTTYGIAVCCRMQLLYTDRHKFDQAPHLHQWL